jgi:hypothetical protein
MRPYLKNVYENSIMIPIKNCFKKRGEEREEEES